MTALEPQPCSPNSSCSSAGGYKCMRNELWRRVRLEWTVEWPLLRQRYWVIAFGILMQYVHGVFTQLAHRLHKPSSEPVRDIGFDLTPELGPEYHFLSEYMFAVALVAFFLWTFSPFFMPIKRFYTAVLWSRLLLVLVVCQTLRIISFSVTQLPGPSFHCRAGQATAVLEWPEHWWEHLLINPRRVISMSCGDLIFSSHTTFVLTGVLAYQEHGTYTPIKLASWLSAMMFSWLIIASRKHYSVDIVIAWYTVPLVYHCLQRYWTVKRPLMYSSSFCDGCLEADDREDMSDDLHQVLVHHEYGDCRPQHWEVKLQRQAYKQAGSSSSSLDKISEGSSYQSDSSFITNPLHQPWHHALPTAPLIRPRSLAGCSEPESRSDDALYQGPQRSFRYS